MELPHRKRKARRATGAILKYELVYFRCPYCLELKLDSTANDYAHCHTKFCNKRVYYRSHRVSREEYLISRWGNLAEYRKWSRKFTGYYDAWLKNYELSTGTKQPRLLRDE